MAKQNDYITRKDLSWKAKGIMTYLLASNDARSVGLNEIRAHATDGQSSVNSGWKELQDAGIIERVPVRTAGNQQISRWETIIKV